MATMPPGVYTPSYDLTDPLAIESEITFVNALMESLQPKDPHYARDRALYEGHLNKLSEQLTQVSPSGPSSADSEAVTPGSTADWSEVPKKRPRVMSATSLNSPGTPISIHGMPGAWPGSKRPRQNNPQLGRGIFDAPENQPFTQLPMRQHSLGFADPFPELIHVYQPVQAQSQPADAFVQEAMDIDELAEFLMKPTPPGGGYAYSQPAYPPRNSTVPPALNLGIPGAWPGNGYSHDWPFPSPMLSPSPDADHDVVNSLIEGIKCQDNDDSPREQTPKEMSCTLMEHQKQALAWLRNMENGRNKGSILADEMGLGKTIEGLSLIIANPSKNETRKTTLIVAPVALMRQWEKEIERHIKPAHRLRVYIYHRAGTKADFSVLREYDIVLTTFNTLAQEQKRIDTRKESEANDRERREPTFKRTAKEKLGLLGPECYWYRVILDEAQCIKNRNTLTSKAAAALQAQYRLCMTGTPMQNSIEELYPLIRFLHTTAYQSWPTFSDQIAKHVKSNTNYVRERGMVRVQALIKSITLRREKTTIVDGRPIVNLPPKHVNIRPVEFSDAEQQLYKAIETKSQVRLNRYLKKGTVSNNYANILVMLLRLRQICCHPHLIKDLGVQVSTEGIPEDELKDRATLLDADVVRRLKDADGDGFECPICYETEVNPTIIVPCGHTCCGECFQKLIDPTQGIRDGNENSAPKCPHCRGILSSGRITDYRHFCKVFCPEKYEELRRALTGEDGDDEENDDDSDESESSDDEDDEDVKDPTLGGFIVDDDVDDDVEMSDRAGFVSDDPDTAVAGPSSGRKKGKGKAKVKEHLSLPQLKKLSLRNSDARKRYLRRLKKTFTSSAKIDETMKLLADIREKDPTEKTLIFSSFTTLLDLLEVPLQREKYKYQRYDGSMKFEDRVEAVNEFMDKAEENIMLISIKAGNAGLNLNKASQVIMLDPFWNPFVEDQAVDRAHRMPQRREVHVHRVLVPETVEDRICKLQDSKREMINAALDEHAGKSLTKLSVNELRSLFGL